MSLAQGSPTLPEASPAAAPRRRPARGGRVLIVDDEPERLVGLRAVLEDEEIDVVVHPSPDALPLVLRDFDPDVILFDLATPAAARETSVPVILFAGHGDRELARLAEEVGAHGYLCKGDEVAAIVNRVKTWIAASRAIRGA